MEANQKMKKKENTGENNTDLEEREVMKKESRAMEMDGKEKKNKEGRKTGGRILREKQRICKERQK